MNPQDALDLLNQFTKFIASNSDDLENGSKIAEEIQRTVDSGNIEAIDSMANKLQNLIQPFQNGFSEVLHDNEVLSGAKDIAGKTVDAVFSPAALAGAKVAAGALLSAAGPVGIAIVAGAAAAEIGAAAYDINRLRVMHDEACHLKEYAEYKENKERLIEDITLKCQANDPNITKKEVRAILKESGALGRETKQSKNKTATNTPEEEQESFKEVMARNLAMNTVVMMGCNNPAMFISMINPVGAAVQVGLAAGRSAAMSFTEMNEEEANKKTLKTIEERRKNGPEYKTYNDLDPESLEYKGNVAKNKIRRIIGAEEQDPTRSEVSRKYDLAEAALIERVTAETLNDLSQDESFINNITNSIKAKREEPNVEISQDLKDTIAKKESELIEFKDKKIELEEIEEKLREYGPDPYEVLATNAANRSTLKERLGKVIDDSIGNDITVQQQQTLSAEAFLLQNEIYNSEENDKRINASISRRQELKEYFDEQTTQKENEIEYLKQSASKGLNPKTPQLLEAEQEVQKHMDKAPEAGNVLDAYKGSTSENKVQYDKLDSLIREQEKLEEYSLILNERQRELLEDPTKNTEEIAKNAKKLNKTEQQMVELEQDLLEHATLASYKQKIQDNHNSILEAGEKLGQPELTEEQQNSLQKEVSSLKTRMIEDIQKHDELEASLNARDKVKVAYKEHDIHLKEQIMDASIQAKEADLQEKGEKLKSIEDRLKTEAGISGYYLERDELLPASHFKDGLERETRHLENLQKKLERGEREDPNSTPLQEQISNTQQNISLYREQEKTFGPLLEERQRLKKSMQELSSDIKQQNQERENLHLDLPQESLKTNLIKQQMELRGQHLDQARETGLYTSEQLRSDTYLSMTEDGEQVTKTDYTKWASSSKENIGRALKSRENERSTYESIKQHEEAFDQHISTQRERIDASISKLKQEKMNSLVAKIHEGKANEEELISIINKLDRSSFNKKVNDKSLIEHLEEKGTYPKVLEAAKAKESKYEQKDLEKERQSNIKAHEIPKEVTPQQEQNSLSENEVTASNPQREKTAKELKKEAKIKENEEKLIKAQEEKQVKDQNQMNELLEMINKPKGLITTLEESEMIAKHIREMSKEALQIEVDGKNGKVPLIELMAEKNTGSHAMAAALDSKKMAFSIDEIKRATQKVREVNKELGMGVTAAKSWKRRKTTVDKLEAMKDLLQKKQIHTGQAASTPNIKAGLAKGVRSLI